MLTWRAAGAFALLALLNSRLTTCRSPGEAGKGPSPSPEATTNVDLAGVDTADLTAREKREWSGYVSELLAPCPDQPVSIAQCVKESRQCKACLPAAQFLVKRVQRGNARAQVEAAFRTRFAADQVKQIDLGNSPSMGAANAPVTIVEWADFECPFCGRAAPALDKLIKEYPGKIRLIFKNYPLSMHPHSEDAARAAMAADKQGKFWEMHHALFQNQGTGLDKDEILRLAHGVGLDIKKFKADWESEAIADRVGEDRKQGDKMDLEGTPLIYIDGRRFNLEQFDLGDDLADWISLEVELKTGNKVAPVPVKEDWPVGAGPGEGGEGAGEPAPPAVGRSATRVGEAAGIGRGAAGVGEAREAAGESTGEASVRASADGGGCFPTGRHYPGIAHLLRIVVSGLAQEFASETPMSALPIVAIDTETTGRDPAVDRIVEIGCVVWRDGAVSARHAWLVNPGRPIPKEAFDVHGISDADVADKPPFSGIVAELLAVLQGVVPLAYNADFDRSFVRAELDRAGAPGDALPPACRDKVDWIDPLTWARELHKTEKSRALGDVCARLGITIDQAHRATDDAEAAARVLGAFLADPRVPQSYGAFLQEQRRIARMQDEERARWRNRSG